MAGGDLRPVLLKILLGLKVGQWVDLHEIAGKKKHPCHRLSGLVFYGREAADIGGVAGILTCPVKLDILL